MIHLGPVLAFDNNLISIQESTYPPSNPVLLKHCGGRVGRPRRHRGTQPGRVNWGKSSAILARQKLGSLYKGQLKVRTENTRMVLGLSTFKLSLYNDSCEIIISISGRLVQGI